MNILILGGPKFLGRATIDAALAVGHTVTLFNRGQTNADLYPQVEKLRGDRDGQLDALKGRTWDAVIDNCGYVPRVVRQSADLLADHVGRYVFISTISVYGDLSQPGVTEDSPVAKLEDETTEDISSAYGGLKALCEQVVQEVYSDRGMIIRPGLIVGPHDLSNRFTYWVTRAAQGGDVLAPANPDHPVQIIDVRDLAAWMIRMAENDAAGVYNATGPATWLMLGQMLETCKTVAQSDANFVWASEEFLSENEVAPWSELPVWLPDEAGWSQVKIDRALAAGLTFRPLADTVHDTLAWAQSEKSSEPPRAGMSREREAELLRLWRERPA